MLAHTRQRRCIYAGLPRCRMCAYLLPDAEITMVLAALHEQPHTTPIPGDFREIGDITDLVFGFLQQDVPGT